MSKKKNIAKDTTDSLNMAALKETDSASSSVEPKSDEAQALTLRCRIVFKGMLIGVLLFCAAFVALEVLLPTQDATDANKNYGYVYSGAKSSSVSFTMNSTEDNSLLLFGSSELSTPETLIPEVPSEVFGQHNYGVNLTYVGEAYDQSLWHAIAAGAYSRNMRGSSTAQTSSSAVDTNANQAQNSNTPQNAKVAIIVSPTWFSDGGIDNETFKLRFSYNLYREFCSNPSISDASKAYVAQRLAEQGVDNTTIQAGMRANPVSCINDGALNTIDDLSLRKELCTVRTMGMERPQASNAAELPSFDQWRAWALQDAEASCNNDWGFDADFWDKNIEGRTDILKNSQLDETLSDTCEYQDFAFFLKVCKEVGFEPLVIISPVHGEFYDLVGIEQDTRTNCYNRIKTICATYDVSMADFSNREYEAYFLHDIVHFGWTGWVDVEEALYNYVKA